MTKTIENGDSEQGHSEDGYGRGDESRVGFENGSGVGHTVNDLSTGSGCGYGYGGASGAGKKDGSGHG